MCRFKAVLHAGVVLAGGADLTSHGRLASPTWNYTMRPVMTCSHRQWRPKSWRICPACTSWKTRTAAYT